jgi:hypothetical protein
MIAGNNILNGCLGHNEAEKSLIDNPKIFDPIAWRVGRVVETNKILKFSLITIIDI